MSNIFEQATRRAIRFASTRGLLNTEQLWDLPLQSKSQFDLDNVARAVNAELKAVTEDSFVKTTVTPGKELLEMKLEIVKHIIAVRLAENEEARTRAANAEKKARLIAILGDKQDEALKGMTAEELQAQIAALG